MLCECGGRLSELETYCTDAYEKNLEWYRDIKKKCVCQRCGKNHDILVDTVKQDKWFK